MSRFAEPLSRLIDELNKLPGIGRKTAQRLAFHLLRTQEEDAIALAEAIRELKAHLRLCSVCSNITDIDPCVFCVNPARNQRMICVVEEPSNIASVEKTKRYTGVYHVLHGALSPLNGIGPQQLRIDGLLTRAREGQADEIILATNPTTEGEATAMFLAEQLRGLPVRITRIATGIPAGADIEYADEVTMARAMEGRHEM
ncbi:MAG TPA: recombination mediator RecR [Acidobacteriaceae bacterium]|nr:recombination mediator RecR [Acidobacteriaceae bacterium]